MKSLRVAVFLGFKSIVRGNFGVTLLTICMLMLANMNLNFVSGLLDGIVESANDKLINTYSSHIIIQSSTDNPYIRNINELIDQIIAVNGVKSATYRNTIGAEIAYDEKRVNCSVRGIEPEQDSTVFDLKSAIFEGSYLDEKDTDQILLGVQIAGADRTKAELYSSSLKTAHAGDRVKVTFANGISKQYTVKGVFYTEFIQTDVQAYITAYEFQTINPLTKDRATNIYVLTYNTDNFAPIIASISKLRPNLESKTWQETAGIVSSMTNSFSLIRGILDIINMLVAGITVFIVTYIDLTQKRRQIGIERAIGITPAAISLSYLFRALFYAVIAIILSLLLYNYVVLPLEASHPRIAST